MIADIELLHRKMASALAVPVSMIHDEMLVSFAQVGVTAQAVAGDIARMNRAMDIAFSDIMRAQIGLPPISAVDRLADLLKDDHAS